MRWRKCTVCTNIAPCVEQRAPQPAKIEAMASTSSTAATFRFSKLLRDAMRGEAFSLGSRTHISRPIDGDSLIGRHEGRGRRSQGAGTGLSSKLQKRIGSSRQTAKGFSASSKFKFDPRQRAIVKIHYFGHGGGGAASLGAHARYIARDGAAKAPAPPLPGEDARGGDQVAPPRQGRARHLRRHAERSVFYDARSDRLDGGARAARWARADHRHFRIILSAENGARLGDLQSYTREVMRRAEAALATRLEWVAVDHWDTDNPHTHIILRGRHEDGRDLVIPRDYVSHGLRSAAQDIATERLGPRGRGDARFALQRQALAHGPTRLDRMIEGQLNEQGRIRVAQLQAPDRSPELSAALKARAHELKRLGFASEIARNILQFEPGWQDGLKAMELHLDIRKALLRSRAQQLARGAHPVRQLSKALRLPNQLDR